jgi:hypothetical protein
MMWAVVKIILVLASASTLAPGPLRALSQSQLPVPSQAPLPPKLDADKPAPACAKILQMTSSDWVANVTAINNSSVDAQLRAIRIYGGCYDARTKRLAAALAKAGKGPSMGARGDFNDFETALKDFTKKALAISNPSGDALKTAYASLYEKQFRYAFYQSYGQSQEAKNVGASSSANNPAPHRNSAPAPANRSTSSETNPESPASPRDSSKDASAKNAGSDTDEMTKAKNRFGELLDALPEDQLHAIHAAFGKIVELHPINAATQLALYRYAIFVLEPLPASNSLDSKPPARPFSPPPF